jgi:hypothetical protein
VTSRHEVLPRVVEAIAEAEGCSPHELGYTLYEHTEPEVICTLVTSDHADWQFRFRVPDHAVELHGDGRILVDGDVVGEWDLPSQGVE